MNFHQSFCIFGGISENYWRELYAFFNILGGMGCHFLKLLMVSDKTIHKAFRLHKTAINKTHKNLFSFSLFTQTIHWL